jgi:myo-inositol-1(or 4)-monophosphatase
VDIGLAEQVAIEAAEAAGASILNGVRNEVAVFPKGTGGDVLTSLEPTAERCIIQRIRGDFPFHQIHSEESGLLEGADRTHLWVVDPLDGSNNVAIGLHTFAVGIALCVHGVPVLGVVHDPILGLSWRATRDRGVVQPINSPARSGCGRVVAWTQGHGVGRRDPTARSMRMVLESRATRVLQLWAPLISWAMLAGGTIDGFVGYRAEPWEMPTGLVLAREAGIGVRDLDGRPFDERVDVAMAPRSFVAAREAVIEDLLDCIREAETIRPTMNRLLNGG